MFNADTSNEWLPSTRFTYVIGLAQPTPAAPSREQTYEVAPREVRANVAVRLAVRGTGPDTMRRSVAAMPMPPPEPAPRSVGPTGAVVPVATTPVPPTAVSAIAATSLPATSCSGLIGSTPYATRTSCAGVAGSPSKVSVTSAPTIAIAVTGRSTPVTLTVKAASAGVMLSSDSLNVSAIASPSVVSADETSAGAAESTFTTSLFTASALPTPSNPAYFTVVVP